MLDQGTPRFSELVFIQMVDISANLPRPDGAVVLVVDDDEAVRGALKFSLELEGFDVRLYDGREMLLADRDLPAEGCLVIDHRSPDMDGLALLRDLRARQVEMPAILMVSDHLSEKLRGRATGAGVLNVLEKPLSDSALIESIRHAFVAPAQA